MAHGFGFGKLVPRPYDEVLAQTREALKQEGFGVITEVDVRATLREKLGLTMAGYTILGACNPRSASQVIAAEPEMGLFMPCNVIVYETDGGTQVSTIDAMAMLTMSETPGLDEIAREVDAGLRRALDRL